MNIIETKNLVKMWGEGSLTKEILKGVNLTIRTGEAVAIVGKSGAGKSTLLHQLSALDVPNQGQVLISGKDVHQLSEAELADFRLYTFGYVFQDYALIKDLSVVENVLVPLLMRGLDWSEANQMAKDSLQSVGLAGKEKNVPAELSGGEQQRVSLARAIVGKPKILFADEPTANLDSASGESIIELFKKFHANQQTIVMVTHEVGYTKWCDRVIVLGDGQILSDERQTPLTSVKTV